VGKAVKVELSIRVAPKDVALLVASSDHVVDGARELQARWAGHQRLIEVIGTEITPPYV
jgi:hypothetical protein